MSIRVHACLMAGMIVTVLMANTSGSAAGWELREKKDPFTDEMKREVCSFTEHKDEICFSSGVNEKGSREIWVSIELPKRSVDVFAARRWPMVRVDENKPVEPQKIYDLAKRLGAGLLEGYGRHEPRWLSWRFNIERTPGAGFKEPESLAVQVVNGKRMTIRLYLHGGYQRDTLLDLSGFSGQLRRIMPNDVI